MTLGAGGPDGATLLHALRDRRRGGAFILDFDGSLAPIVRDPLAARPLPRALDALRLLVPSAPLVAVVSGRPVAFLDQVLDVPGLVLAGLYGLERGGPEGIAAAGVAAGFEESVGRAADAAARHLAGLLVERKGALAVTIHWRGAPEREAEAIACGLELAEQHGLEAMLGRKSVELRPPVGVDKGTTVESLVSACGTPVDSLLIVGDDQGDLPAFDAADRLVAGGAIEVALRVAVRSSEAPVALLARADMVVDGPEGVADLLEVLAGAP